MGLDIAAYRGARLVQEGGYDEKRADEKWETERYLENADFPDRSDGLPDGHYEVDDEGVVDFRAGSYSGYNQWREQLALAAFGVTPHAVWARRDRYRGLSFYELIDFTDCDGFIGPKTAAKLAADFAEHQERIFALPSWQDASWLTETYANFRRAFELASGSGVVVFA